MRFTFSLACAVALIIEMAFSAMPAAPRALARASSQELAGSTARIRAPRPVYYLALGDSLAYGLQPNGDYTHGYVDDLYRVLRHDGVNHLVDLGCNGETSTTFLKGPCPHPELRKYPYSGPQLQAALTFIHHHPNSVKVVTLNLGINDLNWSIDESACAPGSDPQGVVAAFDANFSAIVTQLLTALRGRARVLTMTEYDPYENACAAHPQLNALVGALDARVRAVSASHRVPVADVFTAFGGTGLPYTKVCTYTWTCSSYHDGHPTRAGYAVIASLFRRAGRLR